MGVLWPTVHARLVVLVGSLPGWSGVDVFDGPPVTGDAPTDYVTVGFVQGEDAAGSWETNRTDLGWLVEESGSVRCELVSSSGEADVVTVRGRVFDLINALDAAVRGDGRLGVLPPASTTRLVVDVVPVQGQSGAVVRLPFTVEYFARRAE